MLPKIRICDAGPAPVAEPPPTTLHAYWDGKVDEHETTSARVLGSSEGAARHAVKAPVT